MAGRRARAEAALAEASNRKPPKVPLREAAAPRITVD
jgi:hypothetical protein